jgi:hypothetical protein
MLRDNPAWRLLRLPPQGMTGPCPEPAFRGYLWRCTEPFEESLRSCYLLDECSTRECFPLVGRDARHYTVLRPVLGIKSRVARPLLQPQIMGGWLSLG